MSERDPQTTACEHLSLRDGPVIPLRYGSTTSEVCTSCGAWRRRRLPHIEPWHPADKLTEAMEAADDI